MTLEEFVTRVSGRLIVSCQASAGHPLRDTAALVRIALATVEGGAAAIRCGGAGGIADVAAITAAVPVPVIGLTKDGTDGVYITPTVAAARAVAEAGAHVVAVDGTARPRPDAGHLYDTVRAVHDAGALVLADVSTRDEGVAAIEAGADAVATTLAGHTANNPCRSGPDLALVAALREALPGTCLLAEGSYHDGTQAAAAIRSGANAVVVGTAITDPTWITRGFAQAIAAEHG